MEATNERQILQNFRIIIIIQLLLLTLLLFKIITRLKDLKSVQVHYVLMFPDTHLLKMTKHTNNLNTILKCNLNCNFKDYTTVKWLKQII
jgi:hypothetical protein